MQISRASNVGARLNKKPMTASAVIGVAPHVRVIPHVEVPVGFVPTIVLRVETVVGVFLVEVLLHSQLGVVLGEDSVHVFEVFHFSSSFQFRGCFPLCDYSIAQSCGLVKNFFEKILFFFFLRWYHPATNYNLSVLDC